MINRLVKLLLQRNYYIQKALQITYPFVFLDEFQDTTDAQYDLLLCAFANSQTVFTAVGDDKQRIMGWAGAMPDAFDKFETTFKAKRISLLSNWRSHEELVRIQNMVASKIDPNVIMMKSLVTRTLNGRISAILRFVNKEQECNFISHWIKHQVCNCSLQPHDIAILVRSKAKDVEKELLPYFARKELKIRNADRLIGDIKIQDLLEENLTKILIPLFRLVTTIRSPKDWESFLSNLQSLRAVDPSNELVLQQLQSQLGKFVCELRNFCQYHKPESTTAQYVAEAILQFVSSAALKQNFPEYHLEKDFKRVWTGFCTLLQECVENNNNWEAVLNDFEGVGQVALMTIHKSKGLEFHTVLFYGLDEDTWWSLKQARKEELNTFFVALTRAKQRVFFSRCDARGKSITWLEQLLHYIGIETIFFKTAIN